MPNSSSTRRLRGEARVMTKHAPERRAEAAAANNSPRTSGGEISDLAEVYFHDAGGPGERSQKSPADARRLAGSQLSPQPDDGPVAMAGRGPELHGKPSGRDGYVADQTSRHTTHP
jgi:hypothetical protein